MINQVKVGNLVTQLSVAYSVEVAGENENVRVDLGGDPTGDPENQVVLLTWEDDPEHNQPGLEFSVILTEQGLSDALVKGNSIFCLDHEGEEVHLRLWERQPMACVIHMAEGAHYSRMNVK